MSGELCELCGHDAHEPHDCGHQYDRPDFCSCGRPTDDDLQRTLRLLAKMVEDEWPDTPWRAAGIWGNAKEADEPIIEAVLTWAGFKSDRLPPVTPSDLG